MWDFDEDDDDGTAVVYRMLEPFSNASRRILKMNRQDGRNDRNEGGMVK